MSSNGFAARAQSAGDMNTNAASNGGVGGGNGGIGDGNGGGKPDNFEQYCYHSLAVTELTPLRQKSWEETTIAHSMQSFLIITFACKNCDF